MNRFAEKMVCSGLVTACRLAGVPTIVSPFLLATTEGVVRFHSAFGMIFASPHSINATAELVVPRSIPIIFGIFLYKKLI